MAHAVVTSFIPIIDTNGVPINGAKVYVYEAGTTTLKTIYSDSGLTTPATNPITVNSRGMHAIRYVAAGTYKIATTESDGTAISDYSWDNIDTGVAVGSGALAVASGGTGSSTAAGARTNLSAASATEVADIASDVATLQDALTGTDATQLAAGTTAQRPVSPSVGQIRWNSTTSEFETYDGAGWYNVKTSENAASTSAITAETVGDTYVRPDRLIYSPRVAKAWAQITVSGGTYTLAKGTGFSSSITKNAGGDITLTLSSALGDANFGVLATAESGGAASRPVSIRAKTTSTVRIVIYNGDGSSLTDPISLSVFVFTDA